MANKYQSYEERQNDRISALEQVNGIEVDDGNVGIPSIKGEQGEKGEQGIQGVQGVQGEKGDNGADGITTNYIDIDVVKNQTYIIPHSLGALPKGVQLSVKITDAERSDFSVNKWRLISSPTDFWSGRQHHVGAIVAINVSEIEIQTGNLLYHDESDDTSMDAGTVRVTYF